MEARKYNTLPTVGDLQHQNVWTSETHLHFSITQRSSDAWKTILLAIMNSESILKSVYVKIPISSLNLYFPSHFAYWCFSNLTPFDAPDVPV